MNEEERKSIKNLKKYIEEDGVYKKTLKYYSDFDKFCYNHCKDIDTVLILVEKLQKALVDEATSKCWLTVYASNEVLKNINKQVNNLEKNNIFKDVEKIDRSKQIDY